MGDDGFPLRRKREIDSGRTRRRQKSPTRHTDAMNRERERLESQRRGAENWRLWGPYMAERAWGTVREDYGPDGDAWNYFGHDQARARAYRWSEDGLGGLCDEGQRLCFALALWNGRDPILKERVFGLTGYEGNHGEDVKEYYFYLDGTPTHSFARYLYKYPQDEYPYDKLLAENGRRSRSDPPFNLLDTGVFAEDRYWDVDVTYAKASPERVLIRIEAFNRGPCGESLHVFPTLWFRNTWSWEAGASEKPGIRKGKPRSRAAWTFRAVHPDLGVCRLFGRSEADLLFTENESDFQGLWGVDNPGPFRKDAFHRRVVQGDPAAVNPRFTGTKAAAWHRLDIAPGAAGRVDLVLAGPENRERRKGVPSRKTGNPFEHFEKTLEDRRREAGEFYGDLLPGASGEDREIFRQALSGLVWNKQFYHYAVDRWLDGDLVPPPATRRAGRNARWRHLSAADIVSMPDTWEYPWFAAWDLAFQAVAFSLVDPDLAREQIALLLSHHYLHPGGQIPAYEWAFDDANPPVHAWAALECFRAGYGKDDKKALSFLKGVFNKLVLNYGWWLNRKDPDNRNVFEGGFLGLDNISVYDRSRPLPPGYSLRQADASGWVALFALNLTVMALELAREDRIYEEMAIQFHSHFFAVASAMHGHTETGISLWDDGDRFFKDALTAPDGSVHHLPVFSWVGLIPLFACETVGRELLEGLPRYRSFLEEHAGGIYDGHIVCACPHTENARGDHLFSAMLPSDIPAVMERVLNPDEFLSPWGVRSLSKAHETASRGEELPGFGVVTIRYEPGESETDLFGGNSNWRGPVWMPLNFLLVSALDKLHRYLTESFTVPAPVLAGRPISLGGAADLIAGRLLGLFRRGGTGTRAIFAEASPFQKDPRWKDLLLFHEYFHGESGRGLGAAHQTGWTALAANLLKRAHGGKRGPAAEVTKR